MFQEEVERQREEGERQFQDRLAEGRLQAEGNFTQQVSGIIYRPGVAVAVLQTAS